MLWPKGSRLGFSGRSRCGGTARQVAVGAAKQRSLLAVLASQPIRRQPRRPDRRLVGRAAARWRSQHAAGVRVEFAAGARARGDRDDAERVSAAAGAGRVGRRALRAAARSRERGAGLRRPRRCRGDARRGLALWRGPALADFRYEAFAQAEAGRLEELRLVCLEERIEAELALGRHAGAGRRAGGACRGAAATRAVCAAS